MLVLPRDLGGTIRVRAPRRPDAAPTVQVLNKSGGVEVAAGTAASLSTVDTTLSSGAAAGAVSVSVAATTGMVPGDEFVIGTDERATDFALVESISGTTVTLRHPLLRAYANASVVRGTYISYAVAAAVLDVSERDWQARFSWKRSTVDQPLLIVRFDVSRYAPAYGPPTVTGGGYLTINDVRVYDPRIADRLAVSFDWEGAFHRVLNEVYRDLGAGTDVSGIIHDDDFRELAALKFFADFATLLYGPDSERQREMWAKRFEDRFRAIRSAIAVDADHDNAIEEHERGAWGGWAWRA